MINFFFPNLFLRISSEIAKPTALEIPCPKGPVVVSMPVLGGIQDDLHRSILFV